MAFSDNLTDLEHLIADAMGNALEGARRALAEQIQRRSESGLRDARERSFRDLREATTRLDGAQTQADVLSALLEEGGRFASRTALFLTFADGARGWAAYGFSDTTQGLEDLRLSYDEDGLGKLAAGRGAVNLSSEESAELARHLGGGSPAAGVLVPLVLHDRIAAALYADQLRGSDVFVPAALQLLVYTAAQVLEAQGVRARASTPTLVFTDQHPGGDEVDVALPLWDQAAVAAAAAAAAPAPAREPKPTATFAEPDEVSVTARTMSITKPPLSSLAPPPTFEPPAPEPPPAPAPWEEVPEEPVWSAPALEPPPTEEPAPSWQPSWQMEESPAAAEPAAEAPQEEAWVYAEQGFEAEATYEAEAEVAEEATDDTVVEEVDVEPVEAPAEAAATWQSAPAPRVEPIEPPELVTSPLYAGPLYPSEATVRISRDLLPSSPASVPAPPPPDVSQDRTVTMRSPAPAPAPPPIAPPVPAPEVDATHSPPASSARPAAVFGGGGSTEVQAPPDLEGPGWAFRTTGEASTASYRQQTEDNTGLHEEARRLARLLVSEIKLYNEEQVEEGRRQRDIYPRLQEDIDRSRQMYEERVDPRVRDEVDYFHQEMINILAGGDSGALGM